MENLQTHQVRTLVKVHSARFNTVTYMTDHLQGREGDSRMVSSWYGRNRKVKLNALDKRLEYAKLPKMKKMGIFPHFLLDICYENKYYVYRK